jgi:S-adenosylmethionine uptake transporter
MLMMALGMLLIPGIDAIAKLLSASISPGQVSWGRFVFQTLFMLPFVLAARRDGRRRLTARRLGWDALRGVLLGVATLFFFSALKHLPMADAIAIFFIEPLILTLLSAALLGERIGWRRLTAILVGFCGALVIVRPSWEVFGWAALLPAGAACCFALYMTVTRHAAQQTDPASMQLWAGVFGALLLSAALAVGDGLAIDFLQPAWPAPRGWLLLARLGAIATTGHLFVVMAMRRAPAGILAPFQYLEIISATLLGLIIFGDFPDAATWLGVAIVVSSGLYVFHRERRLARTPLATPQHP